MNRISSASCGDLAKFIVKNKRCKRINLSFNSMGNKVIRAIMLSLEQNSTMKVINLAANDLSDDCAETFFKHESEMRKMQIMKINLLLNDLSEKVKDKLLYFVTNRLSAAINIEVDK